MELIKDNVSSTFDAGLIERDKKDFKDEFFKQLKKFATEDIYSEYDYLTIEGDEYLVRLFEMQTAGFDGDPSMLYMFSEFKKEWVLRDKKSIKRVFPIVRIILAGEKANDYNEGDIVFVPVNDVSGETWNPEFMHLLQFSKSQGMAPIVPEGMRQRIPNVEVKWDNYRFQRPWVEKPEEQDFLTYIIPGLKIKGRVNLV